MNTEKDFLQKTVTVGNQMGLHARVATMMVQAMRNYSCQVTLMKDGMEVDAGSVLGLLLLAATPGSRIIVKAQGPDSRQAIQEITRLIEDEEFQSER
jgi:phosphocarrier protein HPr